MPTGHQFQDENVQIKTYKPPLKRNPTKRLKNSSRGLYSRKYGCYRTEKWANRRIISVWRYLVTRKQPCNTTTTTRSRVSTAPGVSKMFIFLFCINRIEPSFTYELTNITESSSPSIMTNTCEITVVFFDAFTSINAQAKVTSWISNYKHTVHIAAERNENLELLKK